MKPNFLIVGAAKSGTTALYYYLQQHPEITFPEIKEPKYFSSINNKFPFKGPGDWSIEKFIIKDENKYDSLFRNLNTKRVGEASPDYLFYSSKTIPEIKEKLGDIPIIIILRNPVYRAYSAYTYLKRDMREKLAFRDALKEEKDRKADNWDFIWSYKEGSTYYQDVKKYKENFQNVKVVIFEHLINNPQEELASIFNFLKVDKSFEPDVSTQHNPSGEPTSFLARFLLRRDNPFSLLLRNFSKVLIPRNLLEKVASKNLKKTAISEEDKKYLSKYFKEDISQLEKLLKIDLSLWKNDF